MYVVSQVDDAKENSKCAEEYCDTVRLVAVAKVVVS